MKKKGEVLTGNLLPWIILILIILIFLAFYGILNGWFGNTWSYFKDLLKFGR